MNKAKIVIALKILLLSIIVLCIWGCSSLSYYSQSVVGHSRLMLARKPIDKVISQSDEKLATQLKLAKELKEFAVSELALPNSKSYESYVELKRDFPVWTIVAAQEFSIKPKQWCYLVIGCASYRGYFKRDSAIKYAEKLKEEGFEVSVGGAPAYSTLGWFADPILPSMMRYGDVQFAETLFHELAHQELYIDGDSAFNEAFATVVGQAGAKRWLAKNRPSELSDYQNKLKATLEFNALLVTAKSQLSNVYESNVSDIDKRELKKQAFADLESRYQQIKAANWQGAGWFDNWFGRPVNNARLAGFATYYDLVPKFEELLKQCDGDLTRFYLSVKNVDGAEQIRVPKNCL